MSMKEAPSILCLFLVFCLISTVSFASKKTSPSQIAFSTKVYVVVDGPEEIQGEITSYIMRELRSIGDVEVVEKDQDPEWELYILAMSLRLKDGERTGYVLSVTVLRSISAVKTLIANHVASLSENEEDKESIEQWLSGYVLLKDHWLQKGPPENLKSLCESIVASFDGDHIESDREYWRKTLQRLREAAAEKKSTPD